MATVWRMPTGSWNRNWLDVSVIDFVASGEAMPIRPDARLQQQRRVSE